MTGISHRCQFRIYYEDTDHGGVIYYANYLKYMERGRTEYLRAAGIELDDVETACGVMFAVTEANVRYRASGRFNDLIEVDSVLTHAHGARLAFRQQVWRTGSSAGSRRSLLAEAEIKLACIDKQGAPKRIPSMLLPALKIHQSSSS
ncbi:MAG: YbgC/FadM family acyl-CoA thioesterase [Mariprofundaceae bacterium]|nr:YbgC/FadM family acyl-CoA thioesterase [Mariprofundaceae bacterium]